MRRTLAHFSFGLAVTVLYTQLEWHVVSNPALPLSMMGGALSLFLAFRNNSAYDRWWEARALWGSLVNTSRTFVRQVLLLTTGDVSAMQQRLGELQIAYVHALRCHLRGQNPFPEITRHVSAAEVQMLRTQRNVPLAILGLMNDVAKELFARDAIDSIRLTSLDRTLVDLCNVQGACERIKNTPLPRQYEYFPRVLVALYCLLLPFGLVEGLGLMTPVVSTLTGFIFVSLESIGKDIEDPFENTMNDTPMSALSRAIEINLRQQLGQKELLPEATSVDGFVY